MTLEAFFPNSVKPSYLHKHVAKQQFVNNFVSQKDDYVPTLQISYTRLSACASGQKL